MTRAKGRPRGKPVRIVRVVPLDSKPVMWHVALDCGHVRTEHNGRRWMIAHLLNDAMAKPERRPAAFCRRCSRGEPPAYDHIQLGDLARLPESLADHVRDVIAGKAKPRERTTDAAQG